MFCTGSQYLERVRLLGLNVLPFRKALREPFGNLVEE